MIEAADIVAMLSERVSEKNTYQSKEDKRTQELIQYLYKTIQTFLPASSFEIYDESTIDQTDSSDNLSEDKSQKSLANEESESVEGIDESDEQTESTTEEEDDEQWTHKFCLYYMKQVLD